MNSNPVERYTAQQVCCRNRCTTLHKDTRITYHCLLPSLSQQRLSLQKQSKPRLLMPLCISSVHEKHIQKMIVFKFNELLKTVSNDSFKFILSFLFFSFPQYFKVFFYLPDLSNWSISIEEIKPNCHHHCSQI